MRDEQKVWWSGVGGYWIPLRLLWLLEVSPQQLKSPQKTKPRKKFRSHKKVQAHIRSRFQKNHVHKKSRSPKKGVTKSPEFDGFLSGRSGRGGGFCWKAWLEPAVFGKLRGRQAFQKVHTCVLKARLCIVPYVRPWTAARESVPTEPLVWQVRPVAPFDQDFERGVMAMTGYWSLMITYMIM